MTSQLAKPLEGTRLIDLTHMLAGPYAGMILADLGCDTVKVEPPDGESTRRLLESDPKYSYKGMGAYFLTLNRNKRMRAGDEMITALHWPKPSAGSGAAFLEISARRGDFALVAAAALARPSSDGSIALDLGLGGVEERPRVFSGSFDGAPAKVAAFTDDFLAQSLKNLTPIGDLRVSADYRRHLARHLGRQVVIAALGQVAPGRAG